MGPPFAPSLERADRIGHVIDMVTDPPPRAPTDPPNRLREWRLAAGLSQEELAEKVGSTGQSIGRYEAGRRSVTLEMLALFARALDCRPADLLADPESVLDDRQRKLLADFDDLPAQDQDNVLDLVEALLERAERRALDSPVALSVPRLTRRPN